MLTKKELLKGALKIIDRMSADKKSYSMTVCGRTIIVLPNVFSPKYFTDSKFFASEIPRLVGKRSMLEIGTGTGAVSLCVALKGSTKVLTTDINPFAVKNAKINFRKHKLNIPVRLGDVFKPIHANEKFDVIFWNHPFHNSPDKPKNMIQKSGLDYQYKGLKSFFAKAKNHLAHGGEILLGTGNIARINQIKEIARKNGYMHKLLIKKRAYFRHRNSIFVDLRVYSFTLK